MHKAVYNSGCPSPSLNSKNILNKHLSRKNILDPDAPLSNQDILGINSDSNSDKSMDKLIIVPESQEEEKVPDPNPVPYNKKRKFF